MQVERKRIGMGNEESATYELFKILGSWNGFNHSGLDIVCSVDVLPRIL
jgi:hypothetical protein